MRNIYFLLDSCNGREITRHHGRVTATQDLSIEEQYDHIYRFRNSSFVDGAYGIMPRKPFRKLIF